MRVLFVCLGNICRSPAAHGIVRALAPDWTCDSAGTGHWHVGNPPYPAMQSAMQVRGFDISDLRARQFIRDDFDRFDLIIAMDAQNRTDIEALRPPACTTPVQLMADTDVPDPYYTGDFETCLDLIAAAARDLISDTTAGPSR